MFKLFLFFLIAIGLSGCTHSQRFAFKLNGQLDSCATKRMSLVGSGGQGYWRALQDCHVTVNVQKGAALGLERIEVVEQKDALEVYSLCWDFVKDRVFNEYYPELRLPGMYPMKDSMSTDQEEPLHNNNPPKMDEAKKSAILDLRERSIPNKLSELNKTQLLMARATIQNVSTIDYATDCSMWNYRKLGALVGRELHRRTRKGLTMTSWQVCDEQMDTVCVYNPDTIGLHDQRAERSEYAQKPDDR
ncbi:MAG: hypothetical protein ACXWTY_09590 [Methylobacter sp.]